MSAVRVLLANRQSLFREAVRVALSGHDDLVITAEAADGEQAAAVAKRSQPDIALVDAVAAGGTGGGRDDAAVGLVQLISEAAPSCRVIVLGESEDERVLIEAIEAGAAGYLTKHAPLADLIQAIRSVHQGNMAIPQQMLGPLLSRLIRRQQERDGALRSLGRLTRREREVLVLLAGGADNHAIADRLVISPQTARTHIQNVLGKLGVHSRIEAASFVIRNGLLDHLAHAEEGEDEDTEGQPARLISSVAG